MKVHDKRGRRRDEKLSAKKLALRIEANGGFRRTACGKEPSSR